MIIPKDQDKSIHVCMCKYACVHALLLTWGTKWQAELQFLLDDLFSSNLV